MSDCRQGARYPKSGKICKHIKAEVGVEIGLMVDVEPDNWYKQPNKRELFALIKEKLIDLFNIDGLDKVLNNICIYEVQ